MDTDIVLGKFIFQRLKWLLNKYLSLHVAYGDIFLVGLEIDDFGYWDKLQIAAHASTDMRTGILFTGG